MTFYKADREEHYMAKKIVRVVGHKNPDTDSICAAIAYANLKSQTMQWNIYR